MEQPAQRSWRRDSTAARRLGWLLLPLALGGWLVWPLLRPLLNSPAGGTLVVVLDGYNRRLEGGLALQRRLGVPLLLIACPQTLRHQDTPPLAAVPAGSVQILARGFDTVTQITALADWLEAQPRPPAQVLLVSDRGHLPRAALAARLAIGARGTRLMAVPAPPAPPGEYQPSQESWSTLLRDALRISAWRASGSTLAWLRPGLMAARQKGCGTPRPTV